ncbi:MAG: ribulose-phosphate 3-epimerase [Endomicrobium sp.]|jgi:ribulose-phosphate 3-epimerase|nr:ribulose-phosphate 3-epimerase [Endomicrobium sp.]
MILKKKIISSSIISADFSCLSDNIKTLEKFGTDWIHIDVMDGHFVPNIGICHEIIRSIRKITNLFIDVHLMITNPEKYWIDFKKDGANLITFHIETECDKIKLFKKITSSGINVGIALNPKTSVSFVKELLPYINLILIMTVNPGFSGQLFIKDAVCKIKEIRSIIDKNNYSCLIGVDGGIDYNTSKVCIKAGANVLISGNYIFSNFCNIKKMKSLFYENI